MLHQLMFRNSLVWNAIPTLVDAPRPPARLTLKRTNVRRMENVIQGGKRRLDTGNSGKALSIEF